MKRRTNAAAGAYLLRRAARLAEAIRTRNGRKREIIDGFLLEGRKANGVASATVIDAPGRVVVLGGNPPDRPNIATYTLGARDGYSSQLGAPDGPYTVAELADGVWAQYAFLVGFNEGDHDLYAGAALLRPIQVVQGERTTLSWSVAATPDVSFPYDITDQLPLGAEPYSAVTLLPSPSSRAGYVLGETEVDRLAPGYQLMPRTDVGYMSFQYQGMPPVGATVDTHTLVVLPVVTDADPYSAASWGRSALLFVLFRQEGQAHERVGHSLWSPDQHSVDFFHTGPWEVEPDGRVNSPYLQTAENWEQFWEDWDLAGKPSPAGGTRPNWIDGLSATWFNGRFVVNARVVALNGDPQAGDADYALVGGSARVRFEVGLDAAVTLEEVSHELWAVAHDDPKLDAPYNRWVAGTLDTQTVRLADPLCTLTDGEWLVECSVALEGSRVDYVPVGLTLAGTAHPIADLSTAHLEVRATKAEETGEGSTTHRVYFEALGAGIMCPTDRPTGEYQLWRPTISYKLWPAGSQFCLLAPNELGFVVFAQWQQAFSSAPASFAVLDLTTGIATVRSELGLYSRGYIDYRTPVHIDCVQRKRLNPDGSVALEAVMLASCEGHDEVRISRDSGATWSTYITGVAPPGGAYYFGSALRPDYRPGTAIR